MSHALLICGRYQDSAIVSYQIGLATELILHLHQFSYASRGVPELTGNTRLLTPGDAARAKVANIGRHFYTLTTARLYKLLRRLFCTKVSMPGTLLLGLQLWQVWLQPWLCVPGPAKPYSSDEWLPFVRSRFPAYSNLLILMM